MQSIGQKSIKPFSNDYKLKVGEPFIVRSIRELNQQIVCSLCAGYFIDATTITECLHTFCKSCIVKYLQTMKACPVCYTKIHETNPLLNLKKDQVMQDIVYKLIDGLYEREQDRVAKFFASRGMTQGDEQERQRSHAIAAAYENPNAHAFENGTVICFTLECVTQESIQGYQPRDLEKKYGRVSARATMMNFQSMIRKKLDVPETLKIDLYCDGHLLSDSMTLRKATLIYWHPKPSPVAMQFSVSPKSS
ncbi:DgyrCDS5547 [Dimorphilus gyrociliatus]|uniref:DgyrCDS5547 n=1 Tax=Dimorphilus gyrociliatus TaxID=2664684 RepID=A0A7I8VQ06_9ANNE|nr:DgyrCDS5547 [Dimorphilus gyrociliatus]